MKFDAKLLLLPSVLPNLLSAIGAAILMWICYLIGSTDLALLWAGATMAWCSNAVVEKWKHDRAARS